MTSVQRLEPARAYAPIAMSAESTVVAEFFPDEASGAAYQSESDLEKALLTQLQAQAYEYLPITTEADLVANLRAQLEALNGIRFSDTEWRTFFTSVVTTFWDECEFWSFVIRHRDVLIVRNIITTTIYSVECTNDFVSSRAVTWDDNIIVSNI